MTEAHVDAMPAAAGWPLKLKLALFDMAIVVLGIGALAWYVVEGLRADYSALAAEQQATSARFVARSIDREMGLRIAALEAMALPVGQLLGSAPTKLPAYLADKPVALKLFTRDLYVLARDGTRVADAPARGFVGQNYADSPYFRAVMSTGKPVVRAQVGRFAGKPVLIVAVPLHAADGSVAGVLAGSELIAPGSPLHFPGEVRNGETGGFHVVALRDAVVVASTDASRVLQPIPARGVNPLFDRRLGGYLGPGVTVDSRGLEIFSNAAMTSSTDWMVIAYLPTAEAFAPVRGVINRIYSGALAIAVAAGLLLWLALRRELAPLEAAARRLAGGDGEAILPEPLPPARSREIGQLFSRINALHRRLGEQHETIRGERDRLELAVAERTGELTSVNADLEKRTREAVELYDKAPCGYFSLDADGRVVAVNATACALLGRERAAWLGGRLEQFLAAGSAERWQQAFAANPQRQRIEDLEVDFIAGDGSQLPVLLTADCATDGSGGLTTRGMLVDNRERRAREARIAAMQEELARRAGEAEASARATDERERFIRAVTDAVPSMIGYWDRALHCRFANAAYHRGLDCEPGAMLGRHVGELLPASSLEQGWAQIHAALDGVPQRFERVLGGGDGAAWNALVHYLPDCVDGQVRGFTALVSDVSELKQAERRLEAANAELALRVKEAEAATRAKSAFLANISHELRTPMNGILGGAQLLRRSGLPAAQVTQVDSIIGSGRHLLGIINDILDLSSIEAGNEVLEQQEFRLDDVLHAALAVVATAAAAKGLECTLGSYTLPPLWRGDPTRLTQALVNYLGNAVKFTEHGSIRLDVELLQADRLRFSVTDTGIGIPEDRRAQLFEAFEQADNSSTRRHGGTGLGLAINRRIAAMMDGEVGCNSSVGKGSCFWISVRLEALASATTVSPAPAMATAEGPEATLRRNYRGRRVLVVDDEEINRGIATRLLDDAGLETDVAADGLSAVQMADRGDYAAILMDLQMPQLDGIAATRAIRCLPGGANLPILAVTANVRPEDRRRCREVGIDAVIAKPFAPETLFAALLQHLQQAPPASQAAASDGAPQPCPEPAPATELPGIAGLDCRAGLSNVGGNPVFYRSLLRRFRDARGAAFASDFAAAIAAGDSAGAMRLAHSLKGLCGTLGASKLQDLAERLQNAIRIGDNDSRDALAAATGSELQRLLAALAELGDADSGAAATAEAAPGRLLSRLAALLQARDTTARDGLRELLAALPAAAQSSGAAVELRRAVASYDYATALESLWQLADSLGCRPDADDEPGRH